MLNLQISEGKLDDLGLLIKAGKCVSLKELRATSTHQATSHPAPAFGSIEMFMSFSALLIIIILLLSQLDLKLLVNLGRASKKRPFF